MVVCAANFLTYLIVDVFFFHRMDRKVPSYKRDLTTMAVYLLFGLAALRFIFKLEISSIVTTTTVLTAAVAFAMQSTLSNVVSSFYVQDDFNLNRNTWLSLPEHDITGEIVNVGFRYTTIRTIDNQKALVPNNLLMQNIVRTLGARGDSATSAVHTRVGLGYDMPPEKAIAMLRRILLQEEHVVKDPPPVVVLFNYLDSSVEYDMKYCLDDYSHRIATHGSVLKKVWYAVTREGYGIPFPHREVIVKTPREPLSEERKALPDVLQRTEILKSLDEEEIRKLSERVRILVFGPGEEVVRQGDAGDSLFVVRRGTLEVRIDGTAVGNLREGDFFGEMSLLTGEKRSATVSRRHRGPAGRDLQGRHRAGDPGDPRLLESLSATLAERQAANIERLKSAGQKKAAPGKDVFLVKLKTFFGLSRADGDRPMLTAIGRRAIDALVFLGEISLIVGRSFLELPGFFRSGFRPVGRVLLKQVLFTGVQAWAVIVVLFFLIGALVISQIIGFAGAEGAPLTGKVLVWVVVRELGPLFTAVIVIARSGAAIAAELASMKIDGELGVLEAMGIPVARYLVMPRVLGVAAAVAVLALYAEVVAIAGGFLVGSMAWGISFGQYSQGIVPCSRRGRSASPSPRASCSA